MGLAFSIVASLYSIKSNGRATAHFVCMISLIAARAAMLLWSCVRHVAVVSIAARAAMVLSLAAASVEGYPGSWAIA